MQNKQAIQLVEKIQKEIRANSFESKSIVEDLKKIREISMEFNTPVLVKALRLAYEHIEENDSFLVNIPNDEPLDSDDDFVESFYSTTNNLESFEYFLSLILNFSKKSNLQDLKEYNNAFLNM